MAELRPGPQDAVGTGTLAALARAYPGLGGEPRIVRDALSANSASCLFDTAAGRFFAKGVSPDRKPLDWLVEEHRIVRHLVQAGFPTPRVLVNDRGSTVTALAGRYWAVYAAARGEARYARTSVFMPFGRAAEAASAGETLARLHLALADFPSPRRRPFAGPVAQCDLQWEPDVREGLGRLLAGQPDFRAYLFDRPDLPEALAMFDALRQPLLALGPTAAAAGLPAGLVHGDWIKRNLCFEGDAVVAVVDFDLCNAGPTVFDLALALSAAGYPWPILRAGGSAATGQADALRAGYEASRPLSDPERVALGPLVATGRFEFHVSLAATSFARGHHEQAAWFWEGQVATLRWWYDRGVP